MSGKKQRLYTAVFRYLNEHVFSLRCGRFMTDFEKGLRNALEAEYGHEVDYHCCWFHHIYALRRNASRITGFFEFVWSNQAALRTYYKFQSLALLPAGSIRDAFVDLKDEASAFNNQAMTIFVNYYERQWMTRVFIILLRLVVKKD